MVEANVINAFNMMWDPFPEPVMLVHKSRTILAVNAAAQAAGVPVGVKCSSLNPENKTDGHCRQCRALEALRSNSALEKFTVASGRHVKGYWLPLKDVSDVYIHFGVTLNDAIEAAASPKE